MTEQDAKEITNGGFNMKIDLRKLNLRKVPIGTIVTSLKGYDFELISRVNDKESWKDLTSGLTWNDVEDEKYKYDEAIKNFSSKQKGLPTSEEFEIAERHGFREILPNFERRWFVSSSLYSYSDNFVRDFGGDYGDTGVGDRDYYYSVRCVGR